MTQDYNIQLKVRNNYLLTRMRAFGYETAAELSRVCGTSQVEVGKYLNLSLTPYTLNGDVRPSIKRIAETLFCFVEDLFPAQHLNSPLTKNIAEMEVSLEEVQKLTSNVNTSLLPDALLMHKEALSTIERVVKSLPKREAKILELRFGLFGEREHSLKEVCEIYGLSPTRVQQIEVKSLRRLRHPGDRNKAMKIACDILNEER